MSKLKDFEGIRILADILKCISPVKLNSCSENVYYMNADMDTSQYINRNRLAETFAVEI